MRCPAKSVLTPHAKRGGRKKKTGLSRNQVDPVRAKGEGVATYYNDNNAYCCKWLQNLMDAGEIPTGKIDDRNIEEVRPEDVRGYTQRHYFAGIGGWALALRLAGWPDDRPVETGSCPCQPFSCAGKRAGADDARHLWPAWYGLIREYRPATIFGEQVASGDGLAWFDGVSSDLEATGYACAAFDYCAAGVGAYHKRQRLFWVADATGSRRDDPGKHGSRSPSLSTRSVECGNADGVGNTEDGDGRRAGHPRNARGRSQEIGRSSSVDWLPCSDGTYRATQPGLLPLAHVLPRSVGPNSTRAERMGLMAAKANGVGRVSGYGNSIVPRVAARFIRAFMLDNQGRV